MNKIKKILEYLVYLYIIILPWQTILILKENFFGNYKNQYASIGIYFSEILLFFIFFAFVFLLFLNLKNKPDIKFSFSDDRKMVFALLLFLIYSYLSIFWSLDKELALNSNLYFLELAILFLILFSGLVNYDKILKSIVISSFFPSLLGIYQFFSQSFFENKFLGLTNYYSFVAGTSIIYLENLARLVRSYGSFPHPNFFAGFLIITLVASFLLFLKTKNKFCLFFVICLQLMALFFTFSRSAWISFALLLFFIFIYFIKEKKEFWQKNKFYFYFLIVFIISLFLIFSPFVSSRLDLESISTRRSSEERIGLLSESKNIFFENYLLGVGVSNYTLASFELYPDKNSWEYQPVHNVFILFLVELGILGTVLFLLFILAFLNFYQKNGQLKYKLFFLIILLPTLLLDHYFLSMYSGKMLFLLYFYLFFEISSINPLFFPKKP